jgi:hydrogenase-1 operon protein HyaF
LRLKGIAMKDFPIPVVAFGAGSQPGDTDFDYVPMPGAEPLRMPIPPDDSGSEDLAVAAGLVERLIAGMRVNRPGNGTAAPSLSLKALSPGALRTLNESLGQGEVSVKVQGGEGVSWRVQETAFPGVWRVLREDARGRRIEDLLEAGDMPAVVKQATARVNGARLDPDALPAGVVNARSILEELRHHAAGYRPGHAAHVVNLTLLPFAPADHAGLDEILGEGPVAILSRGFGNCRITSTRARNVWRVRFYNTMSTLILDTLEVVDIPEAARASPEDYDESIDRLGELLGWLREGRA